MKKGRDSTWTLLKPIVVLVLIGGIITGALAVTNMVTAPVIAAQMAAAEEAAKREVLPQGADFAPVAEEDMTDLPEAVTAVEEAGNGAGYVITTETRGFKGTVRAMFGVDADGVMTGSKVLSHGETEGIGTRVVKDNSDYQKQLPGLTQEGVDGIVAVTGASFSSTAMKLAVQAAFESYTVLSGGAVEYVGPEPPANLTDAALAEYYGSAVFTDVPGGKVSDAGTVVYASGYGAFSDVLVAVLFDENDSIIGLIVDASGETPDIGGQAAQREYTDLFIGATSGKDVDELSGASFTSWAIQDSVDYALANLSTVKGAG